MRMSILSRALVALLLLVCALPASAIELEPIQKVGGTAVTVTTEATLLDDADVPDSEHRHMMICNLGSGAIVYVKSAPTVTAENGIPIRPNTCWSSGRMLAGGVKMYGISTAPTEVRVSEVSTK